MLKLVQEWKEDLLNGWKESIFMVYEERNEILAEFGRSAFTLNKDGCASDWLKHPTMYRKYVYNVGKDENGHVLSISATVELEKAVDHHFNMLQAKVEKKIGKIIEIESLGGSDYKFIGEQDWCYVEVINAGGYNIQCAHTRWIIKKNR